MNKTKLKRIQYNQIFLTSDFENDDRDPSDYILCEEIAWLKSQGYKMRKIRPKDMTGEWTAIEYHFWVPERVVSYMALRWPGATHEYIVE